MRDIEKEFKTNPKLKSHFPNVVANEALKLMEEDFRYICFSCARWGGRQAYMEAKRKELEAQGIKVIQLRRKDLENLTGRETMGIKYETEKQKPTTHYCVVNDKRIDSIKDDFLPPMARMSKEQYEAEIMGNIHYKENSNKWVEIEQSEYDELETKAEAFDVLKSNIEPTLQHSLDYYLLVPTDSGFGCEYYNLSQEQYEILKKAGIEL